jgi:hypothetical protein
MAKMTPNGTTIVSLKYPGLRLASFAWVMMGVAARKCGRLVTSRPSLILDHEESRKLAKRVSSLLCTPVASVPAFLLRHGPALKAWISKPRRSQPVVDDEMCAYNRRQEQLWSQSHLPLGALNKHSRSKRSSLKE